MNKYYLYHKKVTVINNNKVKDKTLNNISYFRLITNFSSQLFQKQNYTLQSNLKVDQEFS